MFYLPLLMLLKKNVYFIRQIWDVTYLTIYLWKTRKDLYSWYRSATIWLKMVLRTKNARLGFVNHKRALFRRWNYELKKRFWFGYQMFFEYHKKPKIHAFFTEKAISQMLHNSWNFCRKVLSENVFLQIDKGTEH